MWQEIVVGFIAVVVVIAIGRYVVRAIKEPKSICEGCSQDCHTCKHVPTEKRD